MYDESEIRIEEWVYSLIFKFNYKTKLTQIADYKRHKNTEKK